MCESSACGASRRSSLPNSGSSSASSTASSRCGRSGWPCPVSCSRQAGCVKKAVVMQFSFFRRFLLAPALQLEDRVTLPDQDLFVSQAHYIQQGNTHAGQPDRHGGGIIAEI